MNGIEKIIERIAADAQAEMDAILAEARAKADAIGADYAKQAEKVASDVVNKGELAAKEREERLVAMADMERRKALLGAKQEMLTKAFDLALEKLCALPDEEYIKLLASLIVKASRTGQEAVILSQKDRTRVGKAVVTAANDALPNGRLTLSEQTRPIKGGLILSDGKVDTNCSFETLVRMEQEHIAGEVAAALFEG